MSPGTLAVPAHGRVAGLGEESPKGGIGNFRPVNGVAGQVNSALWSTRRRAIGLAQQEPTGLDNGHLFWAGRCCRWKGASTGGVADHKRACQDGLSFHGPLGSETRRAEAVSQVQASTRQYRPSC